MPTVGSGQAQGACRDEARGKRRRFKCLARHRPRPPADRCGKRPHEGRTATAAAATSSRGATRACMTDDELPTLLIDQAPDAVIFARTDGVIRLWNAAATAMFG